METGRSRSWTAVLEMARAYARDLRSRSPDWGVEEAVEHLRIEHTPLIQEILVQAGFPLRNEPNVQDVTAIASQLLAGVQCPEQIAAATGIELARVRRAMELMRCGYGKAPYGKHPYGGNRRLSDGTTEVPRTITRTGQMSYRGNLYTIGKRFKGRVAMVQDTGPRLILRFPDARPLELASRHYRG